MGTLRPRSRSAYRRPSPELDAVTTAAMTAIADHLRLGPGYGMAALVDLRWRIGTALSPEGKTKMPYRSMRTKVLAERLGEALGKGYNSTVIFDARRLVRRYPKRSDLPRFATWAELRPFIRQVPPRRRHKQNAALQRPGLLELRRLVKRAVLIWSDEHWLELPCRHPSALLFSDGDVDVVIRIIQPALRYIPIPAFDERGKTVIVVRWGERPVIRCQRQHRRHSQINVKDLRRCILDP